jgi:gliding motility-associated-like protein
LNCSAALLDSSVLANLIGALPDSLWYTLKSNYDTLNNIYDGMVELSALFNTCVITDSVYIKLDSIGSITPQKNVFCPGANVTWGNTHLSSDFMPVWSNGMAAQSISQQLWMDSAVYFYRVDDFGNLCGDTLRYSIDSNLVSVALSSWSSSLSTNVLAPYADTLQGDVYGDGNSYYWVINGVIQDSGIGTYDTLALTLVDTGWYSIGFVGYDSIYGCAKHTSLYYYVNTQAGSYIPNAFSPNGDNVNDLWIPVIHSNSQQTIVTKIYDSYGNKVFECLGGSISWDGTNQNGVKCNLGSYIVQCNYTDLSGNSVQSNTILTIIQ